MSEQQDVIEASGGIVELHSPGGSLIAVIYRKRYGSEWALPKGKRQAGETWKQAALREVEEETGLPAIITDFAGATAYRVEGVPKIVLYWRMNPKGKIPAFSSNEEVQKIEWLTPTDAIERLTHSEERELLRKIFPTSV
jgi:8-oxo-dGTP pyrophosphatase MutT (NUDIX family)